eukprot:TRINITY_DN69132_c0_g1_i1.p1 TRINITY_DN69132_c0_g1~~TRINITY_DN69132_c0_g1_i1.p1  ORF type:complete len:196 (+),score=40.79 TRINITY_DN69132_c0_g1_i1:117-704(+)
MEGQHVVGASAARKYGDNGRAMIPSDVLSDADAPPRSFVTYRRGEKEYVSEEELVGKHIGLFFGGNVSMCWGFARALTKVYNAVTPEHPFEVVYISADNSRREWTRFVKTMPWLAVPFRDNTATFARYGIPIDDVSWWPTFVVVAPNDKVVFEDATSVVRRCVQEKRFGAFGSLLAATSTEAWTFGRFSTLLARQ